MERPGVLHILSDWKWTGPAEPVANLCRALSRQGFPVHLACVPAPPDRDRALEHEARKRNIEPILDFRLDKRPNIISNRRDIRAVARLIDHEEVTIVHVHSTHDHYIGSRAARRANSRPHVVRTNHTGTALRLGPLMRWFARGWTDACVAYAESCLAADRVSLGVPHERSVVIEGAIDLDRFRPDTPNEGKRQEFGFGPNDVVFGVVARIQRRRRFHIIMDSLRRAVRVDPRVRGLILGRGTHQKELVDDPIRQLGLADAVLHPGYVKEGYEQAMACMDAMIFLVPGTDGSCRAAREAMAMGKPVVAARRGVLPELVEHEVSGLVVEDTSDNLTEAILRIARQEDLRRRMGEAAAEKAHRLFRIGEQARVIGDLYMRLARGRA